MKVRLGQQGGCRSDRLWSLAALCIVLMSTPCAGQAIYCAVDRTVVEQSAEWCQQRKAPVVSIASPGKPTEAEANKLLQLQLMALGFDPAGIDGVLGPGTTNAIRQFQRSVGQTVDGLITPALKAQLDERTRPKPAATIVQKPEHAPDSGGAVAPGASSIKSTVPDTIKSPVPAPESRKPEEAPGSSSAGAIAFTLVFLAAILAAIAWLVFKVVRFFGSLPRRRELRAQLQSVTREDEAQAIVGQMSDKDLRISARARLNCFGRFLENAMPGDALTPAEAERLTRIQQVLRLGDRDLGRFYPRIMRAVALGQIDAGMFPEVAHPPVNLQFGEKAYFAVPAQLLEERVVGRQYQGGSHGVSFRIMKGVSYRVGASRGRSVAVRGIIPVSIGSFCITSQRLIFSGNAKSFVVDRKKILSTALHSDGITIAPETGAPRTFQFTGPFDPEVVQRLITWLTNPMRI